MTTLGRAKVTNASHNGERGEKERWPVIVYRLQSNRGWEIYCDPSMEARVSSTSKSADNSKKVGVKHAPMTEELTAAPRVGCIEVRKMRLRIRLFEQHTPWEKSNASHQSQRQPVATEDRIEQSTSSQDKDEGATAVERMRSNTKTHAVIKLSQYSSNHDDDPHIPGSDGWNNNALLVRRLNTLLISTRRGMGAIVFKFKSKMDCVEFCDRLVYLNRDFLNKPILDGVDSSVSNMQVRNDFQMKNGMDEREYFCYEMQDFKRRRSSFISDRKLVHDKSVGFYQKIPGDINETSNDLSNSDNRERAMTIEEARKIHQGDEIISYIVRLAHDEEFRGFVEEIERGLELASDTFGVHTS